MTVMEDITVPEVKSHGTAARFYRHENRDMVEISFVGSKDSISLRVRPEHMAQYRNEWNAYCDGRPPSQRPGTPLTDLPSINEQRAADYIHRNVHNLEELAALNDGQCQGLGHGTLTDRKGAQALLLQRTMKRRDEATKKVQEATAAIGPTPADKFVGSEDLEAVKADVAELKQGMAAILEALTKRKGGRPKKEKAQ